jgi:ubiquinone/menaquinone biosynthesis C-methylase UbiE
MQSSSTTNHVRQRKGSDLEEERQRIRDIYARRVDPGSGPLDPFSLYIRHELMEALADSFRKLGFVSLANSKILEVGCGSGGMLWRLQALGARPSSVIGIDLRSESLRVAHRAIQEASFVEANAAQLPFRGEAFDMVFQFVMFTSVLKSELREAIAAEISRTLRPGGYFVSYDFRYSNPRNPNVRGFKPGEIRALFPAYQLEFRRLTLAPPIGRAVANYWPPLCRALSAVRFLRTHDLCFARKPA